jgi:ATP-dependent DNA helicase RecQ
MQNSRELLRQAEEEILRRLKKPTRPLQKQVLAALAAGENIFASLPTGYGKSLCYWAPAAAWGWKVWVVSPLVSLIQDQSLACTELGLSTASWHGGLNAQEKSKLEDSVREGSYQINFLSPERLLQWWQDGFVEELEARGVGPDLIALDEMHCFEEWRSFRPGYKEAFAPIRRLSERGVRVLGLSRSQAESWMAELCVAHRYLSAPLGRENLFLAVRAIEFEEERWFWLAASLSGLKEGDTALVYCASRAECDETTRWLRSAGYPAIAYHAGLPASVRAARSHGFRAGALPIVCATTAFGMGVDYPRVRRVIHFSLPHSLEAYWQEAGRAGRDGSPAYALALWRRSEIFRARGMGEEEKEKYFSLWRAWASGICRKQAVGERFGLREERCGRCDRCVGDGIFFPDWPNAAALRDSEPWWVQREARLTEWSKQKIFGLES